MQALGLEALIASLADGSIRTLTRGEFHEHSIAWSPKGDEIAFVSNREAGDAEADAAAVGGKADHQVVDSGAGDESEAVEQIPPFRKKMIDAVHEQRPVCFGQRAELSQRERTALQTPAPALALDEGQVGQTPRLDRRVPHAIRPDEELTGPCEVLAQRLDRRPDPLAEPASGRERVEAVP